MQKDTETYAVLLVNELKFFVVKMGDGIQH